MNALLSFRVAQGIHARQLNLDHDQRLLRLLGARCADYLRAATGDRFDPLGSPSQFVRMLKPRHVPPERSFVLGIFCDTPISERLVGVLYFLHPKLDPSAWYIPLLLLEPAARGRGMGSAVHTAFSRWAVQRGARSITVAVAEDNVRARRFWCDRLGYRETDSGAWRFAETPACWKQEYTCRLATSFSFADRLWLQAA